MSRPMTFTGTSKALGLAIALATGSVLLPITAHAEDSTTNITPSSQRYTIAAGPLSRVLNQFANQSGVALSFDAAQLRSTQSAGLKGNFTVEQGFAQLLSGTGHSVRQQSQGNYVIEPSSENTLDPIQVNIGRLGVITENTGSYTTGQVEIGRSVESIREIPNTVNVVTSQQIKDRNITTLDEAMQTTTGVTVKSYGTGTANYIMRGFETDSISIDGYQTAGTSTGTHGHGAPDLAAFERIEVLKGPAGLLQGSAEPGGYINLVRKRALAERKVGVTGFAHSWPGYRLQVDATGALTDNEKLRARAVVAYENSDGYIEEVTEEKKVLYTTMEYDFTDATTASLGLSTEDVDSVPDVGVPTYADGTFADIDRDLYTGAPFNNKNSKLSRVFLELEHLFDNGAM
ncbi:MAG: TonB-dependent siderophore receptor, partial [Alcanivorax sp.]|uniref:TonB-dependent siderophore receptor n=1 Tax=Alcanivorax sp. TaxID=1872427 RepID=UPI003DA712B1